MKAVIVIPTIREESVARFLEVWRDEFRGHRVIVVEDNPEPTFELGGHDIRHYSWADIDRELGDRSWIIPRRTDCVRSYGYYKASQEPGVEMIVTLDDDCYPHTPGFLREHHRRLTEPAHAPSWTSSGRGVLPRGIPYHAQHRELPCGLNHGLWTNVPDLDAVTQLANSRLGVAFEPVDQTIPLGSYFPMCGMNLAWKPELTPAMYFLLMGFREWPYDRFGDIWCGVLVKKICDHLGIGVTSGAPLVEHQRASNVWANLRKEAPGYEVNETLWREVDSVRLSGNSFRECYAELARGLPLKGDYWDRLREAMMLWTELF